MKNTKMKHEEMLESIQEHVNFYYEFVSEGKSEFAKQFKDVEIDFIQVKEVDTSSIQQKEIITDIWSYATEPVGICNYEKLTIFLPTYESIFIVHISTIMNGRAINFCCNRINSSLDLGSYEDHETFYYSFGGGLQLSQRESDIFYRTLYETFKSTVFSQIHEYLAYQYEKKSCRNVLNYEDALDELCELDVITNQEYYDWWESDPDQAKDLGLPKYAQLFYQRPWLGGDRPKLGSFLPV